MIVTTETLEIQKKKKKTSKKDKEYIVVRAEDEAGKLYELCDKDVTNFDAYKKGLECKMKLDIEIGKYTNISIVEVLPVE